jgi:hypothetical protein
MKRFHALALAAAMFTSGAAFASPSPVSVEIVGTDGQLFREFPVNARDGALRSYLQAEKGARYQVRVRNTSGQRLGLVIAVDGRNIISGGKSDLARTEPMYVLAPYATEDYAGWRANLDAINEFYFTDWRDSYAEAFGDRSARGVIAVAVYGEVAPPPVVQPYADAERSAGAASAPAAKESARRDESPGTGYGDRRVDHAVQVEFVVNDQSPTRHFIKYEWRETLCRKRLLECGEKNRFWDESTLGFAPPPPRGR